MSIVIDCTKCKQLRSFRVSEHDATKASCVNCGQCAVLEGGAWWPATRDWRRVDEKASEKCFRDLEAIVGFTEAVAVKELVARMVAEHPWHKELAEMRELVAQLRGLEVSGAATASAKRNLCEAARAFSGQYLLRLDSGASTDQLEEELYAMAREFVASEQPA